MMSNESHKHLRDLAVLATRRLQSEGFTAFWAGGCVRDIAMEKCPKDYDIVTNATPSEVTSLFPRSVTVGKAFGVVRAPVEGVFFEIATFRKDYTYRDGRRPEKVSFTDPMTDAKRRDFTINALFYDPVADKLHDYVGGREDIAARVVRCVGNPAERFAEDHLRMLRAIRFAASLDFSLHPDTAEAIKENAASIGRISAERIREEFTRILVEACRAGDALVLMDSLGLLEVILPEVTAMKGQVQPPEFHPEGDVFKHTVLMLNNMSTPTPTEPEAPALGENDAARLAYLVLLHDVAKPLTAHVLDGRIRFDGHAAKGAELVEKILRRLHFSSDDIELITYCIRNHMRFMDVRNMKRSTLRRLVGAPTFPIELELHRLDCLASHGDLANYQFLLDFLNQIAEEPVLPEHWITGHDLMELGIPEGPQVGFWRTKTYDAQLEGRFKTREELLNWLKKELKKSLISLS